jgi:hypothetical protein
MWIAIGLGVVGFLAFMFVMFAVVPKVVLRRITASLSQRIAATFSPDQIVRQDTLVVSFGLESRGKLQGRGNGALVLTATELRWLQLVPHSSDVSIPLGDITGVATKRSHLGKTYGKALLHVIFTRDGQPDSMAWFTTDVEGWMRALEAARATASSRPA